MRRTLVSLIAAVIALAAMAMPTLAAAPTRTVLEIPAYTLADAQADYAAFGEGFADCGDFVILATFGGTVTVTDWGDKMLRHVVYTGGFYNASDPSKSAGRLGNTATWRYFNSAGDWTEVHIHGLREMAVLDDGRHIAVDVGYSAFSFELEEVLHEAGPKGDTAALCDALR